MRRVQVSSVRRVSPIAYALPRTVGSIVHLEVKTVEGSHAALIEQADRCLDNVAIISDGGRADKPCLLGSSVAGTERDLVLVVDADLSVIGSVRAVLVVASVDVNLHRVLLPRVRGCIIENRIVNMGKDVERIVFPEGLHIG